MEITHLANRAPFELSGGEKKRAAIASVLSLRPDVILLDEPTASLDPRTKWVLVNLIRKLGAAGQDDHHHHPRAGDRADHSPHGWWSLGEERRILADGTPEEILQDHQLLIRANLIHEHLHEQGMRHDHGHLIHDHMTRG